ncbi:hypothetical protein CHINAEXTREME_02090 [Halobiforma lacisalsi AJ5]|uniref:DUF8119 domain-containing protein n=1 Tax=Natronobacterium lacisalsi AJ5 TaxID=358396 RepID=M0LG77_NATLA|nr:hypothetical protein [Halobiforma lacisalsi]APW96635.1 hypothetical protein CHINAEXTREME_02090 [Halobiforma lacisalsi AJ5]EMA32083.1 hypothetical protein C445_12251 [Halobiforma lacisalsi AJ5]
MAGQGLRPSDERVADLLVDVAVVVVWIIVATLVFRALELPVTAYYLVVFAGVVSYSLATDPREWRLRSTFDGEGTRTGSEREGN